MSTPVPYIDQTGIHRSDLATILSYFTTGYANIYGSDVYLASDSQDGEVLGLFSSAIDDASAMAVSVYNAFSPATAQGVGLSSNVKINGMARDVPTYSTASVMVVGVAYKSFPPISCSDGAGNVWTVPAVTIPASGQVSSIATCQTLGAIKLASGTALTIMNPTRGLQTVTTTAAASPGLPVETDAELRQRQGKSTSAPATSPLDSMTGNLFAIPTVIAVRGYENDGDINDANGIPGRCISFVVLGGADQDIANAIGVSKVPGGNTYGTSYAVYVDRYGIGHTIRFFRPIQTQLYFNIRLKALTGYTSDVGAQIQKAISDYVNGLGIGQSLLLNRVNVPANLNGAAAAATYEILSLKVARANATANTNDVTAGFTELFGCASGNIVITVSLT
jgi:uncharacterized phage protein gp47/JayE